MRTPLLLAALLLLSATASAHDRRYVNLVNSDAAGIVSVHSARPGTNDWVPQHIGPTPLAGGGESTRLRVNTNTCSRDFRVQFDDGRVLIQRDFNLCRNRSFDTDLAFERYEAQQRLASVR